MGWFEDRFGKKEKPIERIDEQLEAYARPAQANLKGQNSCCQAID